MPAALLRAMGLGVSRVNRLLESYAAIRNRQCAIGPAAGIRELSTGNSLLEFFWAVPQNVCLRASRGAFVWARREDDMNATIHISLETPARHLLTAGGVVAARQPLPRHLE